MRGSEIAVAQPSRAERVQGTCGPWLALIHGWSCDGGLWDDLVPLLTPWARVVALDLAGPDRSDAGGPVTIETMARAAAADLQALNAGHAVLVGHSMGGPVALEAAMLLGGHRRLVIGVDTFTDAAFYARQPEAEIERRVQAFSADFPGTMAAMVRRITRTGPPALADEIAGAMGSVNRASALEALRSLLEWDIEARWPSMRCRVETINSAPLSRGVSLAANLHGLAVHMMEEVGHFPMREDPVGLAALIREIVRSHDGIGRAGSG